MAGHKFDLVLTLILFFSAVRGWRAGFLASILSAVGFIGGGLAGLYAGLHLFHSLKIGVGKFAILLIAISVGSWLGRAILKRAAALIHTRVLFGPFKWVDSLLGVALSLVRTLVMSLIVAHLLLITPWGWAHQNIPQSSLYKRLNSMAPSLITQITKEAESIQ